MLTKIDKDKKTIEPRKKQALLPSIKDNGDDGYRQLNQVSFQQNFQALLGHYKSFSANSALN